MKNSVDELVSYFLENKDDKGIPTLNKQKWRELNLQYDKEDIISALIEYIKKYKPEAPVNIVSHDDMSRCFFKLRKKSYTDFYIPHPQGNVVEKYDDYGKPYKDHGLGIIQMGNAFLDVSSYFNQHLRMECDSWGFKSSHHRWNNAEDLRTVFLALWRLGNEELNEKEIVTAFRMSSYIATQFKPHVAKTIYDMTGAETVFDASCGWGDRLAGFYCSESAHSYFGCDPNPETFLMYGDQCVEYEKLLGTPPEKIRLNYSENYFSCMGQKWVEIGCFPAEEFPFFTVPPGGQFDVAFTSPPYFSTELYAAGSVDEDKQSWHRYHTYEEWRDKFYLPVNKGLFEALADDGLLIVNIMDPQIKKKRYYASDDLITHLTESFDSCTFLGQLGMRIMKRPRDIDKEKLGNLLKQSYIEPIWVFGKNRNELVRNKGLGSFFT
jgi:hypothetical protein